jgi:Tfp pilus assembly protein PilN
MSSFDYLHSAHPDWLRRLVDIRIPERLYAPLLGLLTACVAIAGAWGIEKQRLLQAQHIEAAYRSRFEISERAVRKTRIYYDRVTALVSLDRQIRTIVDSGNTDARRLAEIANNLPPHAWLTQIVRDERGGVSLEGRAKDLAVVAGVLRSLMRAPELRNPTLSSAQTIRVSAHETVVKYVMHVDGAGS